MAWVEAAPALVPVCDQHNAAHRKPLAAMMLRNLIMYLLRASSLAQRTLILDGEDVNHSVGPERSDPAGSGFGFNRHKDLASEEEGKSPIKRARIGPSQIDEGGV